MNSEEILLVIERSVLERVGLFQGLSFDLKKFLQLIPYFLVEHEGRIWSYVRGKKSGEGRLMAKMSMGIGGHINNLDENLFGTTYERAAERELREEIQYPEGSTHRMVALLNDDSNSVGRVHLGVVHLLSVPRPDVRKNEAAITEGAFRSVDELRANRERLETWSQICLDNIEQILRPVA